MNGVDTAVTNAKGVYYITFDKLPGTYTIEAVHEYYIFDPLTVKVTEDTRQLP